jgi:hypothetical protein
MEDNVEQLRVMLQGCPIGHSDQSSYLSKLALSLYSRFEERRVLSISKTLNFPQLPWPLTTAYSKLQHLTAPYNIIGTRSDV